jgi:hypothetical protein
LPSPPDGPSAEMSVAEAEMPKMDELAAKSFASVNDYSISVSSNEAQILRERAAWLRGLDRKYGIVR